MKLNKNYLLFISFALLTEISQGSAICESLFLTKKNEFQFFKPKSTLLFQTEKSIPVKTYTLKPSDVQFDSWFLPKATSPWKKFTNSFVHIHDSATGYKLSQMVFEIDSIKSIHPKIHSALSDLQKINSESKYEHGQFIVIYKNQNNERFVHIGDLFTSKSKTAIHMNEIDYALDQIPIEIRKAHPNQQITLDEVWILHNHTTLSPLSPADLALASEGLYHDQWGAAVTIRMMAISKDPNILFSKSYIKKTEVPDYLIP